MLNYHRQGDGEPLLLIHGVGSQWQVWAPVLEALARERDVIAIDAPGFGGSAPLAGPPTVEALTEAVVGFLDELGLESPHVGGNSMGGWLGLELARRGRARSVVALSPAGFWTSRERAYSRGLLKATGVLVRRVAPIADQLCATAAGRTMMFAAFYGRPWRLEPAAAAGALRNLAASPVFDATVDALLASSYARDGAPGVPVTIAWGTRDRLLLPRQGPRAVRANPGARLVELPGCGHLPMADDPERVAAVLLGRG